MTQDASPPEAFRCSRCNGSNDPLESPPLPSELGQEVRDRVCKSCWQDWISASTRLINEYRLDLMSPEGSAFYDRCLREFLRIG